MVMKGTKMYYKVVKKNLCSSSPNWHNKNQQYQENKYVYCETPGEYLFCFKTLETALKFMGDSPELTVYECEVQGVHPDPISYLSHVRLGGNCNPQDIVLAYGVKLIKSSESEVMLRNGSRLNNGVYNAMLVRGKGIWEIVHLDTGIFGVYNLSELNDLSTFSLSQLNEIAKKQLFRQFTILK